MPDAEQTASHPAGVLFAFDLAGLSLSPESLAVPSGFSLQTVAAVPTEDRLATYRLEQLWAIKRGFITEPHPWTPDVDLHLVEDHPSTAEGFTILARDESGAVVGMHGATLDEPGIGRTTYLVVEPAHRGHGLGRALKAWQLHTAQQVGWHTLRSDTPGDEAAAGVRAMNEALGGHRVESFD